MGPLDFLDDSAAAAAWVLVSCAVVITFAGTRLARVADQLADLTGLGEATFGAVLLGGSTSLPGLAASVTAAAGGHPGLAVSNALGGIAAQTAFLALADVAYRRVNLEHAAASLENLMNGVLLIVLLAVVLAGSTGPEVAPAGVHPATVLLVLAYVGGVRLSARAGRDPLWKPTQTSAPRPDVPDEENLRRLDLRRTWAAFAALALVVAGCGFLVGRAGIAIATQTGLSDTVVGALFTAIATSTPELVTCIAAARQGAPTLAVADIVGGNTFDVLFVAVADVAYRPGSVYHDAGSEQFFLIGTTIAMTGVLLLGMLRRERRGIGNIGFESFLMLLMYGGGVAVLTLAGT